MAKKMTFVFGRMNPMTIGHEVVLNKAAAVGGRNYRIYVSKSQDRKKNPLDYKQKVKYLKKIFPAHAKHIMDSPARTAIDVAVQVASEGYTDLIMIAGSDRVGEFQKLLDEYNGVKGKRHGEYKFDSIKVISAGERDPDASGASGMSASKMRGAAADDDFDLFKTGLPDKFKDTADAKELFRTVQKAMGVKSFKEWLELEEKPEDSTAFLFAKIASNTIWKKEYEAAKKMYLDFLKKYKKKGIALHKAASLYKHVTDRGLQNYLNK